MILNTKSRQLSCIQVVCNNETNAACVCKTADGGTVAYYTVLLVKNRTVARKMLKTNEYECFSHQDSLCFLFPYSEPRTITRYYLSVVEHRCGNREKIWKDLVVSCMTSGIAWPLMYLILNQEQVSLAGDGSIYFGYLLNLEEYTEEITEAMCANRCAKLLLELLRQEQKQHDLGISLLTAKLSKGCYQGFLELLSDIQMVTAIGEKESVKAKLKRQVEKQKDKAFRVLVGTSVVLVVLVIIMLLMKLFLGDVSLFDIFRQSIKEIGTESLLQ